MLDLRDRVFPWALIAAGLICFSLRAYIIKYTEQKNRLRTSRTYGRIVSYERRATVDSPDDFLPVIEFSLSNQTYTVTSKYGLAKPEPPKFAEAGRVAIAYSPSDPHDADLDYPELRSSTELAVKILLYAGLAFVGVGGSWLYGG